MSEESLVSDADDRFFAALNAMFVGDAGPMSELWSHADDVAYLGPVGGMMIGWTAIGQDWEKQTTLNLGGELHLVERHVTVGQDLAVVHHVAKGSNKDTDGKTVEVSLRGTNVFRKENGDWRLIAHHADPLPFLHYR